MVQGYKYMKRKPVSLTQFAGGYSDLLPPSEIPSHVLADAENIYWEAGIRKRGGISDYGTVDASPLDDGNCTTIRGQVRAYLNSTWYTIIAEDDGSDVGFWYSADATSWTELAAETFTTGNDVEFAVLDNKVVAINGTDKPLIIYYDSAFYIKDLEAYDERNRNNDDFYAGQYDASGDPYYIDDTTDAQDVGADDFQLASTTNDDGFYIAGDLTFNKVVMTNCHDFGSGGTINAGATYQYYKDDGDGTYSWGTLSLVTTPDWEAAEDDKTLEFNYPTDWTTMDETDPDGYSTLDTMIGRFVILITFSTAPASAMSCDKLTLSHTQYLTQITGGDAVTAIAVHNSTMYLGNGKAVNYSPYNALTGWNEYDVEYLQEGGEKIYAMTSYKGYLACFKKQAIYGIYGTSLDQRIVRQARPD